MAKILSFAAENFKRLHVIEIKFDPEGNKVFVVGGRNGQGKTSAVDVVWTTLAGRDSIPDVPVRVGADKAVCSVELGDVLDLGDLTVTRTHTEKGNYLTVTNKDGVKIGSPQALLDRLFSPLSFDPVSFIRLDKRAQLETLRKMVGLDFASWDTQRASLYERRTVVNATAKAHKVRLESLPFNTDAPATPVDVAAVAKELEAAVEGNAWIESAQKRIRRNVLAVESTKAHLIKLEGAIAEEEARLEGEEVVDVAPIRERLNTAEEINTRVRMNADHKLEHGALQIAESKSAHLSEGIVAIDREKQAALEAAEFPVPTMSFDEDGVLLNGLPLDQASGAEQLRVSIAMGFALNPELPVLLIRSGSLLDDDSLALVAIEAEKRPGARVIMERVGTGPEVSVVIEDGRALSEEELEEMRAREGGERDVDLKADATQREYLADKEDDE